MVTFKVLDGLVVSTDPRYADATIRTCMIMCERVLREPTDLEPQPEPAFDAADMFGEVDGMEPEPEPEAWPEPMPESEPMPEPEPAPEPMPEPEPEAEEGVPPVIDWLDSVKLQVCYPALAALGYHELDMLKYADDEEVADMLAAVEAIEGIKKQTVRKFKRELAKLRGRGETFA